MVELKFKPGPHDHQGFPAKATARKGFKATYEALELEYRVANQMLRARAGRADAGRGGRNDGHQQERDFPARIGQQARTVAGYLAARYAEAVGCELQVKRVPQEAA